MNTKRDGNRARLAARLLLPWALAGLPGLATAEEPLGDKCNPNQGLAPLAQALGNQLQSALHVDLTGDPLAPGETQLTTGTDAVDSPELVGKTVLNQTQNFSFVAGGTAVAGTYQELIKSSTGDGGSCKQNVKLRVATGCVARIRFVNYFHPLDIVANYRLDYPGTVRSKSVSRSDDGLLFEFRLKRSVCAGESTRFLLMNTQVLNMTATPTLQLVAPDGTASNPFIAHAPSTLQ